MTEERLKQIAYEQGFNRSTIEGNNVHPRIVELLKVAVNEALEEAAEKATTKMVVGRTKPFKAINRDSILNLKII